ncbi:cell division protein FtsZ [Schlegelella sp. ID0723]|uniref:Cell division protein FtsZ n=1 Tax=Piscinibacter koreensis TaxID=2742824 RepID=A0A7Y6NR34_9BURK|nr:cell division protein FtsZ [Schlegelella koreensis]
MSNLQIALASLGVVVLIAIVAHGAWSARRAGPKRALPPDTREDPAFASTTGDAAAGAGATPGRIEPAIGPDAPIAEEATLARPGPRRNVLPLDALIDAFAVIAVDAPVTGELAASHLPATRHVGSKPFQIEGHNVATGAWEPPTPGQRYGELQAGIQLASRSGALNEIEYSEFVHRIQAYAEAIGASADFPDMLDVMARARELDAFASQHDAQLAVHLRARSSAWSPGYIQQHARRHGFMPGSVPGRLVYPGAEEGDPPVLTLTFDPQAALAEEPDLSAVRDATLSFDVPQTPASAEPFVAWQATAQALAVGMDAAIVDDSERPLTPEGFAAIQRALGQLYAALEARDLAAGSPAARRLFS